MSGIANTPEPPYYAVIFTSERTEGDNGYGLMADKMVFIIQGQNIQSRTRLWPLNLSI
ncbi:hypothetical protein [Photobacterium proteolyticum]|uniref:hypothetical protein n=1 Tax=Photobacterium proteolyticum TaxID=1903952 RepID=UPI000A581364|nr:hypothetical protein [Photobacterium proteolyticum]